jgi:hypothetical protein
MMAKQTTRPMDAKENPSGFNDVDAGQKITEGRNVFAIHWADMKCHLLPRPTFLCGTPNDSQFKDKQ